MCDKAITRRHSYFPISSFTIYFTYPPWKRHCATGLYDRFLIVLFYFKIKEFFLCLLFISGQSETSYIVPVIFLSNSLGVPLIPKTIDCEDFESTLEKTDKKETLKKWYKLDNAAEPPCYTLQSIEQHIPNFDVKYQSLI